jgi:hypothetical protein
LPPYDRRGDKLISMQAKRESVAMADRCWPTAGQSSFREATGGLCPPALARVLDEGREVLAERGPPASLFTGW